MFNKDVLFNWRALTAFSGFWVTDATASVRRTRPGGAGGASDPAVFNPTNITVDADWVARRQLIRQLACRAARA